MTDLPPIIVSVPDHETGILTEIEMSAEQLLDLQANGKVILTYTVSDEPAGVTEDGELVIRESAIPNYSDGPPELEPPTA